MTQQEVLNGFRDIGVYVERLDERGRHLFYLAKKLAYRVSEDTIELIYERPMKIMELSDVSGIEHSYSRNDYERTITYYTQIKLYSLEDFYRLQKDEMARRLLNEETRLLDDLPELLGRLEVQAVPEGRE